MMRRSYLLLVILFLALSPATELTKEFICLRFIVIDVVD